MRSTKIILLWSVKHSTIVFMLLFEVVSLQPVFVSVGPKSKSLSSYKRNAPLWVWGFIKLTICRWWKFKGKNILNYVSLGKTKSCLNRFSAHFHKFSKSLKCSWRNKVHSMFWWWWWWIVQHVSPKFSTEICWLWPAKYMVCIISTLMQPCSDPLTPCMEKSKSF